MVSRRRGFRRAGVRAPRRAVEWFDNIINETLTSSDQQIEDLTDQMADSEKKGATIVRLIIDITCVLTTAGTGGLIRLAIGMVDNDALAAGAVPEADDEADIPL